MVPEGRGGACEERLVLTGRDRDSSLVGDGCRGESGLEEKAKCEEGEVRGCGDGGHLGWAGRPGGKQSPPESSVPEAGVLETDPHRLSSARPGGPWSRGPTLSLGGPSELLRKLVKVPLSAETKWRGHPWYFQRSDPKRARNQMQGSDFAMFTHATHPGHKPESKFKPFLGPELAGSAPGRTFT